MQRCLFFLLWGASCAWAQEVGLPQAGARSAALAHTSLCINDLWSSFHNPAASAFVDQGGFALSQQRLYELSELGLTQAAWLKPSQRGAWSLALEHFGMPEYHRSSLALAYAQKLGAHWSLALQLGGARGFAEETGPRSDWDFSLSTWGQIQPQLSLAFSYRQSLALGAARPEWAPALASLMRLGGRYRWNGEFTSTWEWSLSEASPLRHAIGLEYQPLSAFSLRAGLAWQDGPQSAAGLGWEYRHWQADLAYRWGGLLGGHAVYSLSYRWEQ